MAAVPSASSQSLTAAPPLATRPQSAAAASLAACTGPHRAGLLTQGAHLLASLLHLLALDLHLVGRSAGALQILVATALGEELLCERLELLLLGGRESGHRRLRVGRGRRRGRRRGLYRFGLPAREGGGREQACRQ
jgi:hypothetical protein